MWVALDLGGPITEGIVTRRAETPLGGSGSEASRARFRDAEDAIYYSGSNNREWFMSIYVEEMLAQIESLDAFCDRLQKRMKMEPVPSGLEVDADELTARIKEVERVVSALVVEIGRP